MTWARWMRSSSPCRTIARPAVASLPGASYAEPVRAGQRRLFFVPNDPLFPWQWHLPAIRAFDHWAVRPPQLAVRSR